MLVFTRLPFFVRFDFRTAPMFLVYVYNRQSTTNSMMMIIDQTTLISILYLCGSSRGSLGRRTAENGQATADTPRRP